MADQEPGGDSPQLLPVEALQEQTGTPLIWHRAAFVANHWCQGYLLDETSYREAVTAAQNVTSR